MQAHISHNLLHFRRGSGFPRVAPHHLDFPKAPHAALCNARCGLAECWERQIFPRRRLDFLSFVKNAAGAP